MPHTVHMTVTQLESTFCISCYI